MMQHFLGLTEAGAPALKRILALAKVRRDARKGLPTGAPDSDKPLEGHTLAMVFEKSSTRTRVSFEQAMHQLGGTAIMLSSSDIQMGRGETVADTARTLSRYVDAIMLRTSAHGKLLELAQHATVPVINGLTDQTHPCQVMADIMTYEDHRGHVAGSTWAWLGDGNNMAQTLIEASGLFGFHINLGVPEGYAPDACIMAKAKMLGSTIRVLKSANEAVAGAHAVATDAWLSMHQQDNADKLLAMQAFQVTPTLIAQADPRAVFLHCLPAHRGEEVTDAVIDGPHSIVWDEAENRLHVQKAILLWCLGKLEI